MPPGVLRDGGAGQQSRVERVVRGAVSEGRAVCPVSVRGESE